MLKIYVVLTPNKKNAVIIALKWVIVVNHFEQYCPFYCFLVLDNSISEILLVNRYFYQC